MCFVLCLTIAGMYLFQNIISIDAGAPYRFFVDNIEVSAESMASLEDRIRSDFQKPVSVEIYNSKQVLLETISITSNDLQPPAKGSIAKSLDHGDIYSRLKMYVEPDKLDLIMRKIYVDKETFSKFSADLILFNLQNLKESAKPVFLR